MILAHLTDLHIRPPGLPAYRTIETNVLAERALRTVGALRPTPDAVLITGDLTDCGLPAEYQLLANLLRRHLRGLRTYVTPGNHDRRDGLRSALSEWPGVTSHARFVQYAVEDLPVRLVVLDSVAAGFGHGELCAERLSWLDETLAAAPHRPTLLALHHPPIACGPRLMDAIALRAPERLAAVVARHPQVERIVCGHHHRSITGRLGGAVVCVAPAAVHQGEFDLIDDEGRMVLEPAAFLLHLQLPGGGIVSHTLMVGDYPGPFPYIEDPEYPGRRP